MNRRLPDEVEELITSCIEETFKARKNPSVKLISILVDKRVIDINSQREHNKLPLPSTSSIQKRIYSYKKRNQAQPLLTYIKYVFK